jgi:hypothetical protein
MARFYNPVSRAGNLVDDRADQFCRGKQDELSTALASIAAVFWKYDK